MNPFNLTVPETVRNAFGDAPSFSLAMNQTDDEMELIVGGYVGDKSDGLGADQVMRMLSQSRDKKVHVRINSPGGLAFDGLAIFNSLLQHEGGVVTTIEGLAGSAASLIAMSGRPVRMQANASLFIHRALGLALGNSAIMRDVADFLDDIDAGITEVYAAKSGLSKRRVKELLAGNVDGTNFTASEAKELGLVDEVMDLKPAEKRGRKTKNTKEEEAVEPGERVATALALRRDGERWLRKDRLEKIGA